MDTHFRTSLVTIAVYLERENPIVLFILSLVSFPKASTRGGQHPQSDGAERSSCSILRQSENILAMAAIICLIASLEVNDA